MKSRTVRMAIFTAAIGAAACNTKPAAPYIEFPSIIDLGERDQAEIVTHEFAIANRGGSMLTIGNVRTNCSCSGLERINASVGERVTTLSIQPGESIVLQVRLAVRGLPGNDLRTVVAFATNDPQRPDCQIELVVARIRGIAATPASVVFGEVPVGTSAIKVVKLEDLSGDALVIKEIVSSHPEQLSARLAPSGSSDRAANPSIAYIEIEASASAPAETNSQIEIHLSTPSGIKTVIVPVSARVVSPIEVRPRVACLPRMSANGPIYDLMCLCRSTSVEPLKLVPSEVPQGFDVTVQEADGMSPVRMVRIECKSPTGQMPLANATVRLRAEISGREYSVDIPVEYTAKEAQ